MSLQYYKNSILTLSQFYSFFVFLVKNFNTGTIPKTSKKRTHHCSLFKITNEGDRRARNVFSPSRRVPCRPPHERAECSPPLPNPPKFKSENINKNWPVRIQNNVSHFDFHKFFDSYI